MYQRASAKRYRQRYACGAKIEICRGTCEVALAGDSRPHPTLFAPQPRYGRTIHLVQWRALLPCHTYTSQASGRDIQENVAMATSRQIDSRSISAAADDVGRRRIAANLTASRDQFDHRGPLIVAERWRRKNHPFLSACCCIPGTAGLTDVGQERRIQRHTLSSRRLG